MVLRRFFRDRREDVLEEGQCQCATLDTALAFVTYVASRGCAHPLLASTSILQMPNLDFGFWTDRGEICVYACRFIVPSMRGEAGRRELTWNTDLSSGTYLLAVW